MDVDRGLVEAAAAGDRDAFERLVRQHERSVVGLARTVGGPAIDAEDVAQEVFVRVWRSLPRFRGESSFRTWLYRITLNVIRTHQGGLARLRRIFAATPPEDAAATLGSADTRRPAADDVERDVLLRDAIDKALATLPDDMRVALVLRDVQGLDYREIAEALDVPVGTVESRIFRARQRLRPLLERLPRRS